tara:strand:- start:97 stop:345 length:249 start_codon:yes stop_codon:yes gene_type:complete
MTLPSPRRIVKMSLLEYEDRYIPIPLFSVCIGMGVGFTAIYPVLGFITLPAAIFVAYSILTEEISFVEEDKIRAGTETNEEE